MKHFNLKIFICVLLIGVGVGFIVVRLMPAKYESGLDVGGFGRLPVQEGGRLKPLDTIARNRLMGMRGKQDVRLEGSGEASGNKGGKLDAIVWLMDMVMRPEVADTYKVFRIDNAEVLGLFGWEQGGQGTYFSFNDLKPHLEEVFKQAAHINPQEELRTVFEKQLEKLYEALLSYNRLMASFSSAGQPDMLEQEYAAWSANVGLGMKAVRAKEAGEEYDTEALERFFMMADHYLQLAKLIEIGTVPPVLEESKGKEDEVAAWANVGQALLDMVVTQQFPEVVIDYMKLMLAYRQMDDAAFNATLAKMHAELDPAVNKRKIDFEVFFNHFEPFYVSSVLYVLVFLMVCVYWMGGGKVFRNTAWVLLGLAFVVHTFGLIGRMYIQGRPPVTNLYSSAIFIGWASVIIGMIMEWVHKNGMGAGVAGIVGFGTLVIAHNLGAGGDTLEMVRAVLDSNFWLSTHVVVVTMGYSAMFLMGILAIFYVLGNAFKKEGLTPQAKKSLSSMVFGTLCFATLFSFVGTMLGGIWADQSWGRFWGWDPKENGALLIVLWCAIMLHARWGRLVQDRGLMIMAIFGNIVTSWSWFGTNMLGVGLHAYGFMDRAFWALMLFVLSQFVLMGVGFVKRREDRKC